MTMTESTEVKSSDAGNLQLETWPIGRLVPSPRNARKHLEGPDRRDRR